MICAAKYVQLVIIKAAIHAPWVPVLMDAFGMFWCGGAGNIYYGAPEYSAEYSPKYPAVLSREIFREIFRGIDYPEYSAEYFKEPFAVCSRARGATANRGNVLNLALQLIPCSDQTQLFLI